MKVFLVFCEKCFVCYGVDLEEIEGEFDVSSWELFIFGGESGIFGLILNKLNESLIYFVVMCDSFEFFVMFFKDNDVLSDE